jgi:transcriptional regulator with XRE-family HTH domain
MAERMGQRLKALRVLYGWSQRELAKRAGVPNSAISVIEQGSVSPSVFSLEKVLQGFPISLSDFFAISLDSQPANVCHTADSPSAAPLLATFEGSRGAGLTLRAFKRHPSEPPINMMSHGQTLILLTVGKAIYHSLEVEHSLSRGSHLSLHVPTPFRIEPLIDHAEWVVASTS